MRDAEINILTVKADVQQGQELAPKISVEIKKQDHSVLHNSPIISDDQALVSSRLFQGTILVCAEEESEYNPPVTIDPNDNQWTVEKLIKKRRIKRAVKYLIKWLGYLDSENS